MDRFVAYIDILGFKDLVETNTHGHVLKKLKRLKQSLDEIDKREKQDLRTWIFSDSIFIFSMDDTYEAADAVMINTAKVVESALRSGLLVKGAVAHGKITADFQRSIFFGRPLIDAYLLQEEMKLASVVLHHTCEHKILSYDHKAPIDGSGRCLEYPTPFVGGVVNHMHLNWLEYLILYRIDKEDDKTAEMDRHIERLRDLYLTVSGHPRVYIDNTLKFFDECRRLVTPGANS